MFFFVSVFFFQYICFNLKPYLFCLKVNLFYLNNFICFSKIFFSYYHIIHFIQNIAGLCLCQCYGFTRVCVSCVCVTFVCRVCVSFVCVLLESLKHTYPGNHGDRTLLVVISSFLYISRYTLTQAMVSEA